MNRILLPLMKEFAARQPGLGRAYLQKDRLALADSRSRLLGVDEGKMCATFVISTDDPDRVDDVVVTKGIYLGNFKAVPIAFYGHQAIILPIGKWEDRDTGRCTVRLAEHEATATCYFSQRNKQAADVFDLVVEKILRATSIGFNPMAEPVPRDGRKANPISLQRGYVFPKVDLLEISIVGIPAQPTATLVREYLSGRKGQALDGTVRKSLEPLCEAKPAWSNGADLPPEGDKMSKKWRKAAKALQTACAEKAADSVQSCVSAKIPKLLDEGYKRDQAIAIAYSMCGEGKSEEEAKAMIGSDGPSGGYTVPPGQKPDEDKAAAPAVEKQPPPKPPSPPQDQQAGDDLPDDGQDQDGDSPTQGHDGKDPIQIMVALAESLMSYLEITSKRPQPAPTPAKDDDDDEEEDEFTDPDDQEQTDPVSSDRYEFRDGKPMKTKRGKYHHADTVKRCKDCMTAAASHLKDMADLDGDKLTSMHRSASMYHHKELMGALKELDGAPDDATPANVPSGADTGESNHPAPPVQKAEPEDDALDFGLILKTIGPVERRVNGVANAWDALSGRMPE